MEAQENLRSRCHTFCKVFSRCGHSYDIKASFLSQIVYLDFDLLAGRQCPHHCSCSIYCIIYVFGSPVFAYGILFFLFRFERIYNFLLLLPKHYEIRLKCLHHCLLNRRSLSL